MSHSPSQSSFRMGSLRSFRMNSVMEPKNQGTKLEITLALILSVNALLQLLLDVILEILHLIPTRVNHLSLTVINAFVSWKTLSAIQKKKFRFVHEDAQVLFLMEICLIVGDIYYFFRNGNDLFFLYTRLFFLICSFFNWFVVTYIIWKHGLWNLTYQGDGGKKGHELVRKVTQRIRRSMSMSMDNNEIPKELELDFLAKERERKMATIVEPDAASIGEPSDSDNEDNDDNNAIDLKTNTIYEDEMENGETEN